MSVILPAAEFSVLRNAYSTANCILEFGGGRSTEVARELGKQVFTVENDPKWAKQILATAPGVKLHFVNTGDVKEFGWPVDKNWRYCLDYASSVWARADLVSPDVVFIDGRFRVACFIFTLLCAQSPVKILFDDYTNRPAYHIVEQFVTIKQVVGRLAVFDALPSNCLNTATSQIFANILSPL